MPHLQKPPLEQTPPPPPKTHERFRVQISILHAPAAKDPGNFRVRSPPGVALGSRLSAGAQLRDLRSRPRHLSPFRRHLEVAKCARSVPARTPRELATPQDVSVRAKQPILFFFFFIASS
ncbi:hypothetical protein CDAR_572411 [Caerostris darwini]|uniref:Uncharacterized protein n=1 Tax=Caerostris darwini TaxID=1538125 RepID=A0AAV4U6S2_9ARAC|nr:hypothetical protein CDAR_572411 [Caerostris darwini]